MRRPSFGLMKVSRQTALLIGLLLSTPAQAAVGPTLAVQGVLRSGAGTPVSGTFTLVVSLYDAETGGSLLYTTTKAGVAADGGVFDTEIGPFVGANADLFAAHPEVWLEVAVSGEPPLPRRPLRPVATALEAAHAATAGGLTCSECVASTDVDFVWAEGATKGGAAKNLACDTCVSTGELEADAVTSAKVKDGTLVADDVAFLFAAGTDQGGDAIGLQCSDCVDGGDLAANLKLEGDVEVGGSLTACTAGGAGCGVKVAGGGLFPAAAGYVHLQASSGVRIRTADDSAAQKLYSGDIDATGLHLTGPLALGVGVLLPQTTLKPYIEATTGTRLLLRGAKSGLAPALASDTSIALETHGSVRFGAVAQGGLVVDSGATGDAGRIDLSGAGSVGAGVGWRPPGASARPRSLSLDTAPTGGAPVPRVVVLGDGKVGVGTESPETALHVAGTVTVADEIHLGAGGLRFNASTGKVEFSHDRQTWAELGSGAPAGGGSGGGGGLADVNGFADGADGNLLVTATSYTDDVRTAVAGTNTAGSTFLSVASASGFSIGDEVLVITMIDATGNGALAGQYETRTIEGISGTALTLDSGLLHTYSQSTANRHQVIRIPHWKDVTLAGGTLTCHPWDGTTGGVLMFRASGNLTSSSGGVIDVSGKGFRGWAGGNMSGQQYGKTGEGTAGGYLDAYYLPPAGSNGGGGGGLNSAGSEGGGGAGGSLASAGEYGTVWCNDPAGSVKAAPGDTVQPTMVRFVMGGGGGGGSTGGGDCGHINAAGPGGGIAIVYAASVGPVAVKSQGATGGCAGDSLCGDYGIGGSGGGAGGTVIVSSGTGGWNVSTHVTGGAGGVSGHCDSGCAAGGKGGTGYALVRSITQGAGEWDPVYGDGSDGSIFVSGTQYGDDVRSAVSGNNAGGSSAVAVAQPGGFQVGDEILVITMIDVDTAGALAGQRETHKISSISGSTLYLDGALAHTYNQTATRRHQVIRVPSFQDVGLSGGVLTAHPWDGDTGGVLVVRIKGTLSASLGGKVDVTGLGFRGAPGGNLSGQQYGQRGEGVAGGYLDKSNAPPAGGNGGGGGGLNSAGTEGGGGGGGSLGTAGAWGHTWCNDPGGSSRGQSGATVGVTATRWVLGGGGGAGTTGAGDCALIEPAGRGGGIAAIYAKTVLAIPVASRGQAGGCGGKNLCGDYGVGGSGGGSGGTVVLTATTGGTNASIDISGGAGGLSGHCDSTCASGGVGGSGVKLVVTQ